MELVLCGCVLLMAVGVFAVRRWRRRTTERIQRPFRGTLSPAGLIAPVDELFHPSAYEANLLWAADSTLPVPAPDSDGTRPELASGRVVLDLSDDHGEDAGRGTAVRQ